MVNLYELPIGYYEYDTAEDKPPDKEFVKADEILDPDGGRQRSSVLFTFLGYLTSPILPAHSKSINIKHYP